MRNGIEEDDYGIIRYWKNYKLHRKDGPASEWPNGNKFWYQNGKLHREDGLARVWCRSGPCEYYVDGVQMTVDEFNEWKIQNFLKGI